MDPYGFWSCKNSPSTQSPKDSGTEFGANLLPQKAVKRGWGFPYIGGGFWKCRD